MEVKDGLAGFEPGKKAIFIREMNGYNMGKVVKLLQEFPEMDAAKVGDIVRDPFRPEILWCKGKQPSRTWMVETLGDPIVYTHNGELTYHTTGPVPEYFLMPLDDFEQDESLWVSTGAKKTEPNELVTTP